jgi:histidyl-tRNA synthetase
LAEQGKLPDLAERCDCFVVDAGPEFFDAALGIVAELRRAGISTAFSYKRQGLGKQLKTAGQKGASRVVIVGEELSQRGQVLVKDLATGEQIEVPRENLAGRLKP